MASDPSPSSDPSTLEPGGARERFRIAALVGVGIALASVVTLLAAAAGGLYYFLSPTYSLGRAAAAARNHDLATFEKYVDVDGVARSVVEAASRKATSSAAAESAKNPWAAAGAAIGQGFVQMMKPKMTEEVASQLRRAIERPAVSASGEGASADQPTFEVRDIVRDGRAATVTVDITSKEGSWVAKATMRDRGWHWQIAELLDITEAAAAGAKRK